jgi:hypothetical protein
MSNMLRFLPGLFASLLMMACQPLYKAERNYEVHEKDAEFFQPLMNDDSGETKIVLEDQTYPIELQLYKDGRFHYYLKRLGDGWGTWSHKNGYLQLYAERKLFVMNFEIHGIQQDGDALSLEFSDRFGPKFLRLQKSLK